MLLPYSAIDFDDQTKVRNAVEMAGCLVQYKHYGSLCVAIGNNPWAGGYHLRRRHLCQYRAGAPHAMGDKYLDMLPTGCGSSVEDARSDLPLDCAV